LFRSHDRYGTHPAKRKHNRFNGLTILAALKTMAFSGLSSKFVAAESADKQAVRKIQLFSLGAVLLK
jgi:hypothetical protein